jgi:hypothetical protein
VFPENCYEWNKFLEAYFISFPFSGSWNWWTLSLHLTTDKQVETVFKVISVDGELTHYFVTDKAIYDNVCWGNFILAQEHALYMVINLNWSNIYLWNTYIISM